MGWECLLCNHGSYTKIRGVVRDSIEHGIVQCDFCGHVQLNPVPTPGELAAFYASQEQRRAVHGHMMREQKRLHVEQDTSRRLLAVGHAAAGFNGLSILEIGPGEGFFVDGAMVSGATYVDGVEYGESMPVVRYYDAVCAFHVLEHCIDPVLSVARWFNRVDRGGHLFIEVPNHDDLMIRRCQEYASWHYQKAHIHYFTVRSLLSIANTLNCSYSRLYGVQRYSLSAANGWLTRGKPTMDEPVGSLFGGYDAADNDQFCLEREQSLTCDTLFLVVQR